MGFKDWDNDNIYNLKMVRTVYGLSQYTKKNYICLNLVLRQDWCLCTVTCLHKLISLNHGMKPPIENQSFDLLE